MHNNLPIYACSHPQCSDHVSGLNTLRLGPCLTALGPLLKQTLGSLTALLHPSSVYHIIDICIGVMHWVTSCIVKSRFLCSISFWGLTVLIASASATSLPGMSLISKSYSCIVSLYSYRLDDASGKKVTSCLIIWFAYKPFFFAIQVVVVFQYSHTISSISFSIMAYPTLSAYHPVAILHPALLGKYQPTIQHL